MVIKLTVEMDGVWSRYGYIRYSYIVTVGNLNWKYLLGGFVGGYY